MRRLDIVLTTLLCACAPADDGDQGADHGAAIDADVAPDRAVADPDLGAVEPTDADLAVLDGAPSDAAEPDGPIVPPGPDDLPGFAFPIDPDDRRMIHPGIFFGVDHDPAEGEDVVCLGYAGHGFPTCYDGHQGSDFVLRGGFDAMDDGSARVVAAAGGVVTEATDGNYDRCRGSLQNFDPDCDGHPRRSNTVEVEHAHGWHTRYLHLKRDSVAVRVGDVVECGQQLGLVGSSGRSFTPHLHFEVRRPAGEAVDPFAGEASGPQTLWVEQRADDALPGAACDPRWRRLAP